MFLCRWCRSRWWRHKKDRFLFWYWSSAEEGVKWTELRITWDRSSGPKCPQHDSPIGVLLHTKKLQTTSSLTISAQGVPLNEKKVERILPCHGMTLSESILSWKNHQIYSSSLTISLFGVFKLSGIYLLIYLTRFSEMQKKDSTAKKQKLSPSRPESLMDPVLKPKYNLETVFPCFQTQSGRLRFTGSEVVAPVLGRERRAEHYSTSLFCSVLSFLITGRGWASVLKTQCSNGRWSSSEKSR